MSYDGVVERAFEPRSVEQPTVERSVERTVEQRRFERADAQRRTERTVEPDVERAVEPRDIERAVEQRSVERTVEQRPFKRADVQRRNGRAVERAVEPIIAPDVKRVDEQHRFECAVANSQHVSSIEHAKTYFFKNPKEYFIRDIVTSSDLAPDPFYVTQVLHL